MSATPASPQNPAYRYFADLAAQLPEITPDTIVSRTLYDGEQVRAIIFGFAPGQELSEHTASKRALLYFVSGEAELTLGGDAMTRAGRHAGGNAAAFAAQRGRADGARHAVAAGGIGDRLGDCTGDTDPAAGSSCHPCRSTGVRHRPNATLTI